MKGSPVAMDSRVLFKKNLRNYLPDPEYLNRRNYGKISLRSTMYATPGASSQQRSGFFQSKVTVGKNEL